MKYLVSVLLISFLLSGVAFGESNAIGPEGPFIVHDPSHRLQVGYAGEDEIVYSPDCSLSINDLEIVRVSGLMSYAQHQ